MYGDLGPPATGHWSGGASDPACQNQKTLTAEDPVRGAASNGEDAEEKKDPRKTQESTREPISKIPSPPVGGEG